MKRYKILEHKGFKVAGCEMELFVRVEKRDAKYGKRLYGIDVYSVALTLDGPFPSRSSLAKNIIQEHKANFSWIKKILESWSEEERKRLGQRMEEPGIINDKTYPVHLIFRGPGITKNMPGYEGFARFEEDLPNGVVVHPSMQLIQDLVLNEGSGAITEPQYLHSVIRWFMFKWRRARKLRYKELRDLERWRDNPLNYKSQLLRLIGFLIKDLIRDMLSDQFITECGNDKCRKYLQRGKRKQKQYCAIKCKRRMENRRYRFSPKHRPVLLRRQREWERERKAAYRQEAKSASPELREKILKKL